MWEWFDFSSNAFLLDFEFFIHLNNLVSSLLYAQGLLYNSACILDRFASLLFWLMLLPNLLHFTNVHSPYFVTILRSPTFLALRPLLIIIADSSHTSLYFPFIYELLFIWLLWTTILAAFVNPLIYYSWAFAVLSSFFREYNISRCLS